MQIVEEILDLFATKGASAYHGEAVSQAEHALQAADLAEQEGSPDALVVAALLHDVGHLLDGQDEDLAIRGVDGRHEEAGGAWLSRHFGPEVIEPIRLHVAAKRYLCAVDPRLPRRPVAGLAAEPERPGRPDEYRRDRRVREQPVLSRRGPPAALGRHGQGAGPARAGAVALPRAAGGCGTADRRPPAGELR